MRRSGPPARRKGLNRGGPLRRGPGPKTRKPLRRVEPLRAQSARRKAEAPTRAAVRQEVLDRDGHRCQAAGIPEAGPCWGPLDVDEIVSRARRPGGHLDPSNCQALCRGHNGWKEDHPEAALRLGLARHSWDS